MEVILKKTKITKGIVEQSLLGSYTLIYSYHAYDLLGWCVYKNKRYFLLYHRDSKQISKLPYISQTSNHIEKTFESKQFINPNNTNDYIWKSSICIKVYFQDHAYTFNYQQDLNESDEHVEDVYTNIKNLVKQIHIAGQIYL